MLFTLEHCAVLALLTGMIYAVDKQTQAAYDEAKNNAEAWGGCFLYTHTNAANHNAFISMCSKLCGSDKKAIRSITCIAFQSQNPNDNHPVFDPKGDPYILGECVCDNPLIDALGDAFVQALRPLGEVACSVGLEGLKVGVQDALTVVAGAEKLAADVVSKLYKIVNATLKVWKAGGKAADATNVYQKICGTSDDLQKQIDDAHKYAKIP